MITTYLTGARYPSPALKAFLPDYLDLLIQRGEQILTSNKPGVDRFVIQHCDQNALPLQVCDFIPTTGYTLSRKRRVKPRSESVQVKKIVAPSWQRFRHILEAADKLCFFHAAKIRGEHHQIIFCVRRLRDGDYDAWQDLVQYCFTRSMNIDLIDAIGEYIRKDVDLMPLPLITLKTQSVSVHCAAEYLMFDNAERDPVHIRGQVEQPEPHRQMAFKRDHTWTHYKWRLRDDRPKVTSQKTSHSIHWMFV